MSRCLNDEHYHSSVAEHWIACVIQTYNKDSGGYGYSVCQTITGINNGNYILVCIVNDIGTILPRGRDLLDIYISVISIRNLSQDHHSHLPPPPPPPPPPHPTPPPKTTTHTSIPPPPPTHLPPHLPSPTSLQPPPSPPPPHTSLMMFMYDFNAFYHYDTDGTINPWL